MFDHLFQFFWYQNGLYFEDKDPNTLRDVFKIDVNIVNNRRASCKLGRREDPNLFNPKNNGKEGDKPISNNKPEEDKMDQMLNLLKNLKSPIGNTNKVGTNVHS